MRSKCHAFACQAVKAWCPKTSEDVGARVARKADVAESEVVGKYEYDVRFRAAERGERRRRQGHRKGDYFG